MFFYRIHPVFTLYSDIFPIAARFFWLGARKWVGLGKNLYLLDNLHTTNLKYTTLLKIRQGLVLEQPCKHFSWNTILCDWGPIIFHFFSFLLFFSCLFLLTTYLSMHLSSRTYQRSTNAWSWNLFCNISPLCCMALVSIYMHDVVQNLNIFSSKP